MLALDHVAHLIERLGLFCTSLARKIPIMSSICPGPGQTQGELG